MNTPDTFMEEVMGKFKQAPGEMYTFRRRKTGEEHTGVLPKVRGEGNEFARWDGKVWKSRYFLNKRGRERDGLGGHEKTYQKPGQLWTFKHKVTGEEDTGLFPSTVGESNDFAIWNRKCWVSRKFLNRSRIIKDSDGNLDLLHRIRCTLSRVKARARKRNHAVCINTVDELLILWDSQKGLCAACGESIDILKSFFDHDHETGEARGFIHPHCNSAEGHLLRLSQASFDRYIRWIKKVQNRGN